MPEEKYRVITVKVSEEELRKIGLAGYEGGPLDKIKAILSCGEIGIDICIAIHRGETEVTIGSCD